MSGLALVFYQPKSIHDDGLIGFAVGIVAALMAKDEDFPIAGLKAARVVIAMIRLTEILE